MPRTKTLVVVLAGGAGGRLRGLTAGRAKPAVPFGGTHRLVDFPLSNAHNWGMSDVWVVQQYNPMSLSDHLANGRPWDLDRTQGGLMLLHPRLGEGGGWHTGTADSLWRNAGLIREFGPDHLVVLSADAVYLMDYAAIVDEHRDTDADITMVTTEVGRDDAGRYGVVRADDDGRITDYAHKPDKPAGNVVATEAFVMNAAPILDLLGELGSGADEEEGSAIWETTCCPASPTREEHAPADSNGTGVMWEPWAPTGRRTWTSWRRHPRSTSTTPPGRCSPAAGAALPPASFAELTSGTRWWQQPPRWVGRSSTRSWAPASWSKKGRWCAIRCCSTGCGCGGERRSSARSSTSRWTWAPTL